MITITRHIINNAFQMEPFSAGKIAMSYEKNMSFFVIPLFSLKFEQSDWAPQN